jgi:tripartite-type tricarboxylate transporter receptor subunit TctC
MMKISRRSALALCLATALLGAGGAAAEDSYPTRTVTIITAAAGTSNDQIARMIAEGIAGPLGQPVIVDNREGNIVPAVAVAQAEPDGYTILLTSSTLWLAPLLQDDVPYDPVADFAPVTLATSSPNILVVNPGLGIKTLQELLDYAKANPGKLNLATGPVGGSVDLAAKLFMATSGVEVTLIPYKGVADAMNSVVSGETDMMFPNASLATPQIKANTVIPLGVASAAPTELAPGIPTMGEGGLPGFVCGAIFSVFAPAGTPQPIIDRLNAEIVKVLQGEELRQTLLKTGSDVVASTPQELGDTMAHEIETWSKVLQ